jgi:hypothetical protein
LKVLRVAGVWYGRLWGKVQVSAGAGAGAGVGAPSLPVGIIMEISSHIFMSYGGLWHAQSLYYVRKVRSAILPPGAKIFEDFSLSTGQDNKGC